MSEETPRERGDRLAAALSQTMDEKEALEVELANVKQELAVMIEWVMGDRDALTALQSVYNSTTASEVNRVKAAGLALAYERSKPATNLVITDFRERVRQARLWADAKLLAEPRVIEHTPGESDTSEPASAG